MIRCILNFKILFISLTLLFGSACLEIQKKVESSEEEKTERSILVNGGLGYLFNYPGPSLDPVFLGTVNIENKLPTFPDSVLNTVYGDRSLENTVVDLNLSFRYVDANFSTSLTGDFFYEVPVFKKPLNVDALNSSLYWFLKNNFKNTDGSNLQFTRDLWVELGNTVQSFCPKCYTLKQTEILLKMRSGRLIDQMLKLLRPLNASLEFDFDIELKDYPGVFYSPDFQLSGGDSLSINMAEGESLEFSLWVFHPLDSTNRHTSGDWKHSFNSVSINQISTEKYSYSFNYSESGSHLVEKSTILANSLTKTFQLSVSLGNSNLPPVLEGIPALTFQQNHERTVDLSSYSSDPDGDVNLNLRLVSGPSGLVLSGTNLTWNPTESQLGSFNAVVYLEDSSEGKSQNRSIQLSSTADNFPSLISTPSIVLATEGTEVFFDVVVEDLDGDAMEVVSLDPNFLLADSTPTGSGWESSPTEISVTGNQTSFRFYLLPSYLEVISLTEEDLQLQLSFSYDVNAANLRDPTSSLTVAVPVKVTNFDDPPQWTTPPSTIYATETVGFSSSALAGGAATDASFNPTSLSYSLSVSNSILCTGLSINSSTGVISGTPSYLFPLLCPLQIVATDANGLSATSSSFNLETTNTNRAPSISQSLPGSVNLTEGEVFSLDLNDYFSDPDLAAGDFREIISYSCGNCLAKNINLIIPSSGQIEWTVPYDHAGTYTSVSLQYADKYMVDNSVAPLFQTMDFVIAQAPAPVKFKNLADYFEVDEGQILSLSFDVESFSGDSVDFYNYDLSFECSSCPSGLLAFTSGTSANSTTSASFGMDASPTFEAGNGASGFRIYTVKLIATSQVDTSLTAEKDIQIKVININRNPTALQISENGQQDSTNNLYELTIDLNQGSSRFEERSLDFQLIDPDAAFDTYTYAFDDTDNFPAMGELNGSTWSYTPLGCSPGGDEDLQRDFKIKASDSGGTSITRTIRIHLQGTTGNGICP